MNRLEKLAEQVRELQMTAESKAQEFGQRRGIACPSGCGRCCEYPEIEVSVLDFLPLALDLHRQGKAEELLQRLQDHPGSNCILYRAEGPGKGSCGNYAFRPGLCRLFGFAAIRDKEGRPRLATCQVMQHQGVRPEDGADAPLFEEYGRQLRGLEGGNPSASLPIPQALQNALEQVIFLAQFTSSSEGE